jgi:hypothetical protein
MDKEIRTTEFYDDRVYYCPDGKGNEVPIVSVTTKLGIIDKPFLGRWRGDIGNREADLRVYESQQKGKRVHYAWYVYVMGGIVIYNPWEAPKYSDLEIEEMKKSTLYFMALRDQEEMLMLYKLQQFFDKVKPVSLHTELTVYSVEDDEAGTLDNAFLIKAGTYKDIRGSNGIVIPKTGIYIADLKTGNTIDERDVWMQLAAYMNCYKKMKYGDPLGAIILHTNAKTRSGIEGFSATLKMGEDMKSDYLNYKHASALWHAKHPNFNPKTFEFPTKIQRRI